MSIKSRLLHSIKQHGQTRGLGSETFAKLARWYLTGYDNADYAAERNGEHWVLSKLGSQGPSVLLDVGANIGGWTTAALARTEAHIHAFEIAPEIFTRLQHRVGGEDRVTLNEVGLADTVGNIDIRFAASNWGITTGVIDNDIHKDQYEIISCPISTGDLYLDEKGLDVVDYLKIDVEGMEMSVLRGFQNALSSGRIRAVQFEYGMANIYSRVLLKDLFEFLNTHGFLVGKLYPKGVSFAKYTPKEEDFRGGNFVAVKQDAPGLISALSSDVNYDA